MTSHTTTLDDRGDLGNQRSINQRAQVEGTNVVDEAELEKLELQVAEVEGIKHAELTELEEDLELLELEDGVDVEDVGREQTLESQSVEVVADGELLEETQVQRVDDVQVAEVKGVEAQVVQGAGIEDTALLSSGGGRGNGGKSASEDSGELHFDYEIRSTAQVQVCGYRKSGSEQ